MIYEEENKAKEYLEYLLNAYQGLEPWEKWQGQIIPLKTNQPLKRQMYIDKSMTSLSLEKTATHHTKIYVFPFKRKRKYTTNTLLLIILLAILFFLILFIINLSL